MPLAGMQAEGDPGGDRGREAPPGILPCPGASPGTRLASGPEEIRVPGPALFAVAALAEIAGCFAFWAWFRLGASAAWLVPGLAALALFAALLAQSEAAAAGRAYAAYGGVYIGAALLWLWGVEGVRPDRWDLIGAAVCLLGAGLILYGPRGT